MDIGNGSMAAISSIMCFHWCMLPLAVLIGWLRRIPVLYDEHDHYELNTVEGKGTNFRKHFLRLAVRAVHQLCLPWVKLVTCIHMHQEVLKKHLEQWQLSVLELHNFPAVAWRESVKICEDRSTLCFVYIGGVFREKGVAAAAGAFQQLAMSSRHDAELHIFGTGDQSLMDSLMQIPGIFVHKSVTPTEFRSFAAENRCCGLSLLASTPRYQLVGTNCTKLYEYLALGMPVIATRVGEFPEFIEKHRIGLLIGSDMIATELAGMMTRLLEDRALFDAMSQNAMALMSRREMTWENEWQKVEQSGIFDTAQRAA
jgi:glycosyltransferase involved in cell wall biosynthesis